jgi:hypothetical protein
MFIWLYFFSQKSQVLDNSHGFKSVVYNQCSKNLKTLKIENDREYVNHDFESLYIYSSIAC